MGNSKKLLIAAGGTGGHIYPAMGMAAKMLEIDPSLQIQFAAGGLAESPFFDRQSYSWESISCAPFTKKNPVSLMKNGSQILQGIWQSVKHLSSFKPDLVVGFGSYHTFPVLSAARLLRYPIVLHEQNSHPGKVIRLFSKAALLTGIYFPDAKKVLKGPTSLMAMPLRAGFSRHACTRKQAGDYFNLDLTKPVVLIFGGSQGAQFMNQTVAQHLVEQSWQGADFQVLHFAGNDKDVQRLQELYGICGLRACVKKLESRMDLAWRIADFAIVRAGAGTIAEQIEFEVPAIFIPYPYAADGHQESNADFVVEHVGGGWKYLETDWHPNVFSAILQPLLIQNSQTLAEKRRQIVHYKNSASREEFTWAISKLLQIV
ncbi:MAG: UDP-N-acetylglucosamine--N-acetylmuramyl-(pentapeptide) pyrophosphoryl-undecaprenol N-acetylglucosamine transferase [Parachlamydiaceae bacterium]